MIAVKVVDFIKEEKKTRGAAGTEGKMTNYPQPQLTSNTLET